MGPRNVPHANSHRFYDRATVASFLHEGGIDPYPLTPLEAAQASQTPDINAKMFNKLFKCSPFLERPSSKSGSIICINPQLHPYGPSSPGEPGLLFLAADTIPLVPARGTFLLFLRASGPGEARSSRLYRYLGTYARVPVVRTTLGADEWQTLPSSVSGLLTSTFIAGAGYHV
jgi:hypothetical protein